MAKGTDVEGRTSQLCGVAGRLAISLLGLAWLVLPAARAQSSVLPYSVQKDKTLQADTPKSNAFFGRCSAFGKTGQVGLDFEDDAIICATREEKDGVLEVGAGYAFRDFGLNPIANSHLLPQPDAAGAYESKLALGQLGIAIGNVRGVGQSNLVFVANAHAKSVVAGGSDDAGAVEVYDMNAVAPALPSTILLHILPPTDPPPCLPAPPCWASQPSPTDRFGHSLAIADVDGDGTNDLIVGAAGTTEPQSPCSCWDPNPCSCFTLRNAHGRVYVLFGHSNFIANPFARWVAIKAPQMASGSGQQFVGNGYFGLSVDAGDLDADGKAEILVGRPERIPEGAGLGPGRAHLFSGAWVAAQAPTSGGAIATPDPPASLDVGFGTEYETLIDQTPNITRAPAFGLNVFMLKRHVGFGAGTRPDIAVHSAFADYLGDHTDASDDVPSAGALFVFFNDSSVNPGSLVDEFGVKLQTPTGTYGVGVYPNRAQTSARFGFSAAVVDWKSHQTGGGDVVASYLLVGEPDASVKMNPSSTAVSLAGRVFMFPLPIYYYSSEGRLAPAVPQIVDPDPTGLQASSHFGYWISVGDYDSSNPGQEFLTAAWGRNLGAVTAAGQAYSFKPGLAP